MICDTRWSGKGKSGEVTIDLHQADAYRIEDGQIVHAILAYPDTSSALAAARSVE